jgi:hypothetical protein
MSSKKRKKQSASNNTSLQLIADNEARPLEGIVDMYMRIIAAQAAQTKYLNWNAWRLQNLQIYKSKLADIPRLAADSDFAIGLRNSYPDSENYDMAAFRARNEWENALHMVATITENMVRMALAFFYIFPMLTQRGSQNCVLCVGGLGRNN